MHTDTFDWTFQGTWPFPPSWFDTPEGRMHFVDVGPRTGSPVVFAHGNPTWVYLFRHLIPPLVAAGHRVIAMDHLGFGRSDKPDRIAAYGIREHARRFGALLDALDLHDVTLVPHDWGGPIALPWGVRHADRVRAVVLLNTFCHRPERKSTLPLPLRLFRIPMLGELLVKALHLVVRVFLFREGVVRRERMTPRVRAAYLAPHPTRAHRTAILALARQFPAHPDEPAARFHGEVHEGLAALALHPVLIAWGDRDAVLSRDVLARWQTDFPHATVRRFPDAGHFLQEDAHEALAPLLVAFLAAQGPSATTTASASPSASSP